MDTIMFGSLVQAVVDFVKFIRSGDTNGWVTQAATWGAGIGLAFLIAASDFTALEIVGVKLVHAKPATLVLQGVLGASLFSSVHKGFQALRGDGRPPNLLPARMQRRGLGERSD